MSQDTKSQITIENYTETHVRVFSEDLGIEKEISEYFTFYVPGAHFTPQYRARIWDGKTRLYDLLRKTVYTGLIPYVRKFAFERGYTVSEIGFPKYIEPITEEEIKTFIDSLNITSKNDPDLLVRDYQYNAVYSALKRRRALLLSPTASGKSLIMYSILRWYSTLKNNKKCLIIVPTTNLVEQLYKDFDDYSTKNGWKVDAHIQKLYAGFSKELTKNILITTWQSINKLPKSFFEKFDVVFGDEVHKFKARSLITIMEKCNNVKFRIGTTGTIDNSKINKLVLEGLFGIVEKVTTTSDLIDQKKLADLKIICLLLSYDDISREGRKNNVYSDEIDWLVSCDKRNNYITNLALNCKGNTLILYQYVKKHGIPLYEKLNRLEKKYNKKIYLISGDTIVSDREQVRDIAADTNNCVIVASYGTFSTGVNIPSIENIILASPIKSKILNLQSIGRGLRLNKNKTTCNLFDIADDLSYKKWKNHTYRHLLSRMQTYDEEKFNYSLVEVKLDASNINTTESNKIE